ncbi:MAG: hypothetical protein K2G52_08055 [Muribaculaceae bacterium]|nr:hypothetical protein [Muribaculaceae bacterium]
MKQLFPYLIIIALAILPVSSCKKSARDVYAEAVEEWIGREILFPDSMMTVTGEMIAPPTTDFTIVSYYDSTGCTGCRMKLPFWNEFMNKMDLVRNGRTVAIIMIAASDKRDDLKHLVMINHFSENMVFDPEDEFNRLNSLPKSTALQTLLINRNHEVIALGNPVMGVSIEQLYLSSMEEKINDKQELISKEKILKFDFGRMASGEKTTHTFRSRDNNSVYSGWLHMRSAQTRCDRYLSMDKNLQYDKNMILQSTQVNTLFMMKSKLIYIFASLAFATVTLTYLKHLNPRHQHSQAEIRNIEALTESEGASFPCIPGSRSCILLAEDGNGNPGILRIDNMVHI